MTQDESILIKALENSKVVSYVDGKIRVNVKSGGRTTIILRDIPSDVAEEEVKAIFDYENCKPIISLRPDFGDTW